MKGAGSVMKICKHVEVALLCLHILSHYNIVSQVHITGSYLIDLNVNLSIVIEMYTRHPDYAHYCYRTRRIKATEEEVKQNCTCILFSKGF